MKYTFCCSYFCFAWGCLFVFNHIILDGELSKGDVEYTSFTITSWNEIAFNETVLCLVHVISAYKAKTDSGWALRLAEVQCQSVQG